MSSSPTVIVPSGSSRRRALGVLAAPLLFVLVAGIAVPRLLSASEVPTTGGAVTSYERSIYRKFPRIRNAYQKILNRDRRQLDRIDQRLSQSNDATERANLEQRRGFIAGSIRSVELTIARLPVPPPKARSMESGSKLPSASL